MSHAHESNAERIRSVFSKCENCGQWLNPEHSTHSCDAPEHRITTTAAERDALRDADDRDGSVTVVLKVATAVGGPPAYHRRHAPTDGPEPDCRTRHHAGPWVAKPLSQARAHGGYPCRWCFPAFGEVL